eukprot:TRINITY_DN29995_c0_g1_i1.p1 TRINITY_DN29995_c0_g1~~TRINITY_DN29995_c0_g1_i1.p1  ORF type:complete len:285 (+),score=68.67 TRINITY_DN29995_c0_g1_i1:115-969(+)
MVDGAHEQPPKVEGELRAAPLCARPPACGPAKRRPQMRSVSRQARCAAAERPTAATGDADAALLDEVRRLRQSNDTLRAAFDSQTRELQEVRAKLQELQESPPRAEPRQPEATMESCVQTEESEPPCQTAEYASHDVDELMREVAEKGRELRKSQESVRALKSELQQQRQVSEHYRSQMQVLEEQARCAMEMRRQTTQSELRGLSRPSSARSGRSVLESTTASAKSPGTVSTPTGSSTMAAWEDSRRRQSPSLSWAGARSQGAARRPAVDDDSSEDSASSDGEQ